MRRATQLDFKVAGYANVVAHHNRLHQRDSVKKALTFEKETMAEFAKSRREQLCAAEPTLAYIRDYVASTLKKA